MQALPGAIEDAAVSIGQQVPALATGNLPAALAVMFGQSAGTQYGEVRDKGLDIAPAIANSVLTGAAEVIGEKLGGTPGTLRALKGAVAGNAPARVAAEMARAGIRDIPGEGLTTVLQYGTDAAPVIGTNAAPSFGELGDQLKKTAVQTVLQGGMMTGGGAALAGAAQRMGAAPKDGQLLPAVNSDFAAKEMAREIDAAAQEIADSPTPRFPQQATVPQTAPAKLRPMRADEMLDGEKPAARAEQPTSAQPATETIAKDSLEIPSQTPAAEPATHPVSTPVAEAGRVQRPDSGPALEAVRPELAAPTLIEPANVQDQVTAGAPAGTPAETQAAPAQTPAPAGIPGGGQAAAGAQAGAGSLQAAGVTAPAPASATPAAPLQIGRNNVPMAEGGKPFKTNMAAKTARKLQPGMRVIKVDGGYALAEKTRAQLAAQEKAARRMGLPQTSPRGEPIPAHAFIAAAGGLAGSTRADMNMQGNVRVGNRSLFAGTGKGLTIERATEKLIEEGYLPADAGHDQARDLIKRSLKDPQYTPEGVERMAEKGTVARFEDHLAAQQEAAESDPDFDPFPDMDITEGDFAGTGFAEAPNETQLEVQALIAMADERGIDSESIMLDAHDATREGTTQDFYENAKSALEAAIGQGRGDSRPDSGQQGDPPAESQQQASQDRPGEGLTSYTEGDVLARLDALEKGEKDAAAKDAKADAEAKKERDRRDIASRQQASSDNFQLGQDANDALSGQTDIFAAAPAPAPAPAANRDPKTIEDAGEKLGGARKDRAPSLSRELSDDAIATEPFSKIWPADEASQIEDTFMAAVSHTARESVPAKPRVSYKLANWVKNVKIVRSLARSVMDGVTTKENFQEKLSSVRALDGFRAKVELLESLDRANWGRIGTVEVFPDAYRYEDATKVPAPFGRVSIDGRNVNFQGATTVSAMRDKVAEALGEAAPEKRMQFEVRGRPGAYAINKKGDKEYRPLKTFETGEQAFAFIKNSYSDLVAEWENIKDRDNVKEADVRGTENKPRTGEDRRKGKDVSADEFREAFGFRGVEFGNWVAQGGSGKDRQGMLNQAYDALMDLADIVGVPPKAISLNGSLGLGFGSRGAGKASAHFEPDTLVMNLTKTRGAGTLAHEWFHALDNYFSRQRGGEVAIKAGLNAQAAYRTQNFITYRPEPMYVHKTKPATPLTKARLLQIREANPSSEYYKPENWQLDPKHPQGVRPEVERAFADLVEALEKSPMKQRAASMDKNPEAYWSQIIERAARSFENYVISKMMEKGYDNDYLANVRPVQDFPRAKSRYPYLLPEEVAPVADAFDALFSTVKTKETDRGIAMYSRPAGKPEAATAPAAFRPVKTKSGATGFLNADIALGSPRLNVRQPGGDVTRIDFDIRDTAAFTRAQADGMSNTDARDAAHVGILTMDMDKAGQFKSLRNIEIFQSKRGNNSAEKVVGSIIASLPPGAKLHIHDILPTATGFWDKMGAKFPRSEDFMEAYLTPEQYKAAYDTRPRTAGTRGQRQESRATTDGTGRGGRSGTDGQDVSSSELAGDSDRVSTPDQVRAALAARFGPLAARMEARSFLKIWDNPQEFNQTAQRSEQIEGKAQGLWDGETAHLFADAIEPGSEIAVLLHEVGEHASMQKMLGPQKYTQLVDRARALVHADDATALEAVARIPDDTRPEFLDSELLAYMIETVATKDAKASPSARKWLADIVAAVRAWWTTTGLSSKLQERYGLKIDLTPKDIAALAVRAVNWQGQQGSIKQATQQFSRPKPLPATTSWAAPPGSPPVNPNTGGTLTPQPWTVSEPGAGDAFIRGIQNNKIDMKRVRDAIAEQFGSVPEALDPYLGEELYQGKVAARVTELHENTIEPILKKIAVAGANSGVSLDDVNQYLHARHAPERNAAMKLINPGMANNDALSGMSDADAATIMAGFRTAGKDAALALIVKDIDQLNADTRTALVADGLEDAATVQAWEAAYKFYAPLQRDVKSSGTPKGMGFSVRGPESKRAVGSNKDVVNILANIVAQAETAAIRAEKAKVGRALLEMAKAYPNPNFWTVDKAPTKPRLDPQSGLVIRGAVDPMYQTADNVLMVKDYGTEHFIVFNKDSERAMLTARAMKNLDAAPMNKILEVASKGTRFIASLLTQRNPLFWMTNFARDIQGALINLEGTDAEGLQTKVLGNLGKSFKGMHAIVRGDSTGQWARYAKEMQEAGGTTGYMQQFENSDARMKNLQREVDRMAQGKADPRKLGRMVLDFVDDYNDIIENAVRLSVFQTARQAGASTMKAASIAKNITVNFNRKGNLTPPVNALYMFFNASVQGTARLTQALVTSPKAQALVGGVAIMGFLLDALNRAMSDDDEETGRNRYDLIPEFEKSKNWIFMNPMRPGEYVKVPLPLGPHVFHNAGRLISDAIFRKDPRNASEYGWSMASTVLDAFSPLGATSSVGQLIAPSILDPVVQIAENKSFTGGPVYKSKDRGFGNIDPKPAYTRFFENTPDLWKAASKGLNDITGGDKVKPGLVNIEPDILKSVFYTMTGGPGRTLDQAIDATQSQARGDTPTVNRVPFASRFYGTNDDRQRERAYYDDKKRVADSKTQFDYFVKSGRPDLAREVASELGDGNPAKGRKMMLEFKTAGKTVSALNKQIRAELEKQEQGGDRAEQIKTLKARRVKVMGSAVRDENTEDE
ncbi:LPD38 domain-containing protein [Polaromonas sp.]|uniref:LPD38 domain-containing protein n=1 Tax=Polaromonas sp. TaxID=1869339 RepID=UPI002BC25BDA|nr:LPD38 domain-containing protein [Polaromonas sp.]HQS38977.1 LPD5 domain-containing protein [Polaromonas sp.]